MSDPITLGSSYDNDGDMERRKKAAFQMTVWAIVTEPAWRVRIDETDRESLIDFGERTYGDANSGDDQVLQLRFSDPTTLLALSNALANAARELTTMKANKADHPDQE